MLFFRFESVTVVLLNPRGGLAMLMVLGSSELETTVVVALAAAAAATGLAVGAVVLLLLGAAAVLLLRLAGLFLRLLLLLLLPLPLALQSCTGLLVTADCAACELLLRSILLLLQHLLLCKYTAAKGCCGSAAGRLWQICCGWLTTLRILLVLEAMLRPKACGNDRRQ